MRHEDVSPPTVGVRRMQHAVPLWAAEIVLLGALSAGYERDHLHGRLGLSPSDGPNEQTRVPMERFAALCLRLSREMRDELIGLWNHPVPPGTFATVLRTVLPSSTLQEAMHKAFRLYKLICPGFPLQMRVEGELCWLRGDEAEFSLKRLSVHVAAAYWALSTARWLVGHQIPVMQACMQSHRQDERYRESEPFFEAPARYGAGFTGLAFDARWLRRPVVPQPERVQEFLRSAPADLFRCQNFTPSTVDRVRAQLRLLPHQRLPSIEQVAHDLGLSPRSLHRRLKIEGVTFQSFKDTVRRDKTMTWLRETDLSISAIGDRLGYSDPSAFHRSFKRWTGISPTEYRRLAHEERR